MSRGAKIHDETARGSVGWQLMDVRRPRSAPSGGQYAGSRATEGGGVREDGIIDRPVPRRLNRGGLMPSFHAGLGDRFNHEVTRLTASDKDLFSAWISRHKIAETTFNCLKNPNNISHDIGKPGRSSGNRAPSRRAKTIPGFWS